MLGKNKGLKARLAEVGPNMIAIHCIIHRSVLCARLDGHLKQMCNSSLQHRIFRQFTGRNILRI